MRCSTYSILSKIMVATQLPTVTTETSALTNKPSNEQPYTKMQLKSIHVLENSLSL